MTFPGPRTGGPRARNTAKKLAALSLVLACVGTLAFTAVSISASSAASGAALGAYVNSTTAPTALNAALGGNVKYAMDFQDGTSWSTITQSSYPYSYWRGAGYSMVWGIPMLPNSYSPSTSLTNTSGSCYGLSQDANGVFNSNWTKVAQALVANGFGSSVVRLGWEFNGGWFPWSAGGCAAQFVGAYQQIVTTMRAVSGANFTFEWNPTLGDLGDGNLANYYPGSSFVNYIGLDVYDNAWSSYSGAQSEFNTYQTQAYGLNWLSSFAAQQGKQIVLPEWGLGWGVCAAGQPVSASGTQVCGGDNPTFINDMASWIKSNNVFEDTFWDNGSSSVAGCPSACTPIGYGAGDYYTIAAGNINSFNALVADFGSGSGSSSSSSPPTTTPTFSTTTTTTHTTTSTTSPPATTTTTAPPGNGITVSRVSPASGPAAGGTTVTITGTGFSGATALDFGSVPATITSSSATSITASAPAAAVGGTVDVTVTTPVGRSAISPTDEYTYVFPKPSVSSVAPAAGVAGTSVTITGNGFTGATGVAFGSTGASFSVTSNTSIVATAPAGAAKSVVDITVTGPGGSSTAVTADQFTYGPAVTSVSPASGSHLGGTLVTVKGVGFTGATAVTFGGVAGTNVSVAAGGTQLTVNAPAEAAGTVDVQVTVGGVTTNAVATDHFTYI
ncbi:MAG TPA: IPT/TIG domain-containing protein [Acidimicrobiales bacterium]|nr:IPT/TIG domain-containing protein [Acidimicrobiales bacterium]